ncbi:MAG: TonB family protein, partial [bacterium]
FVRVKPQETLQRKNDKPEKPPAPQAPPPEPPAPELDDASPQAEKVAISAAPVSTDIDLSSGGFSLGVGEGDYLPIVKVAPMYPSRAATRGIEGWVVVQYTVTTTGTVKDVVVLESQPASKIFHRASIEAAKKFKYKPRVQDGKAVEVPGVRNKFTFELED